MEAIIYSTYLCIVIPLSFICFLLDRKARNIIIFYIVGTFQYLVFNEFSSWLYEIAFIERMNVELFYTFIDPILIIVSLLIPFVFYIISASDKYETRLHISIALATGFATIQSLIFSQYDEMNYLFIISDAIMLTLWHIMSMLIINKATICITSKEKSLIKAIVLFILVFVFVTVCVASMTHNQHQLLSLILFITYIPIVLKYYMDLKKARIAKRHIE